MAIGSSKMEKLIEEAREEQKIPKHLYVNGQKTDLKYENGQVEGDGVYSYFCMPSKILLEGKDVDTETIIKLPIDLLKTRNQSRTDFLGDPKNFKKVIKYLRELDI